MTYNPEAAFFGEDVFTYQVTDRGGPSLRTAGPGCSPPLSSPVRTVTITVRAANTVPVAQPQDLATTKTHRWRSRSQERMPTAIR